MFFYETKGLRPGGGIWFAAQTSLRVPDFGLQHKLVCVAD